VKQFAVRSSRTVLTCAGTPPSRRPARLTLTAANSMTQTALENRAQSCEKGRAAKL